MIYIPLGCVVLAFWLYMIGLVRKYGNGARDIRIAESIRTVLLIFAIKAFFVSLAYSLHLGILQKLSLTSLINMIDDPIFGFVFQGVPIKSTQSMAGLLTACAVFGACLTGHSFINILGLVSRLIAGSSINRADKVNTIMTIVMHIIFAIVGILLIAFDAMVFALNWDLETDEDEMANKVYSAGKIAYPVFLAGVDAILFLSYRNFINLLMPYQQTEEQKINATPTPQEMLIPATIGGDGAVAHEISALPISALADNSGNNGNRNREISYQAESATNQNSNWDPFEV